MAAAERERARWAEERGRLQRQVAGLQSTVDAGTKEREVLETRCGARRHTGGVLGVIGGRRWAGGKRGGAKGQPEGPVRHSHSWQLTSPSGGVMPLAG